jgi:hypothetical protein
MYWILNQSIRAVVWRSTDRNGIAESFYGFFSFSRLLWMVVF